MKDFKQILLWRRSHQLTLKIYKITLQLPKQDLDELISQMRRLSTAISTAIAGGYGRANESELAKTLMQATCSASELEYQLLLVKDLNYLDESLYNELTKEIIEIRMMLYSSIQKLR